MLWPISTLFSLRPLNSLFYVPLIYFLFLDVVSEGRRQANEWPSDSASSSTTLVPHSYSISSVEHCCLGRNWNDLRRTVYIYFSFPFRSDVLFLGKCRTTVRLAATLVFQGGGILALLLNLWRVMTRVSSLFIPPAFLIHQPMERNRDLLAAGLSIFSPSSCFRNRPPAYNGTPQRHSRRMMRTPALDDNVTDDTNLLSPINLLWFLSSPFGCR
jgi:hypothetical protein